MISRIKILLILTSVLITPIKCVTCRFYLDTNSIYGCEMFEVNVTEENQTFEITGDHVSGYSDTNVTWLNVTDSGVLNFISLTIFETFANLQTADLSKVEVKEIRQENFLKIHSVRTIILEGNSIQKIPSMAFMNCWQLRDLRLNDNAIDTIEDYAFSTEWVSFLSSLTLSNNLIANLPENSFANLTSLRYLNLDDNQITELSENVFSTLSSLTFLYLDNNFLVKLPSKLFLGTRDLSVLSLNSNQLESLDLGADEDPPIRLSSLYRINVNNNKITSLSESVFNATIRLSVFEASWNNISSIHPSTFHRNLLYNALNEIHLSHNSLTEIIPETFQRLSFTIDLLLNNNKISSLPNDTFGTGTFVNVDISSNELEIIHANTFAGTIYVRNLNLSNNRISAIDRTTLRLFPRLENLLLAGNLCSGENFEEIVDEDIQRINESLEECYRNYDELNNSSYLKASFITTLVIVALSGFL